MAHKEDKATTKKAPPTPAARVAQQSDRKRGCYFRDGVRRVDYIVVWEENLHPVADKAEQLRAEYRHKFEDNLIGAGVEIEREISLSSKKKIHYVKLFVSWQTMCYYAEYLGFRAPLELFEGFQTTAQWSRKARETAQFLSPMQQAVPNAPKQFYTCPFSASKLAKFLGSDNQDSYFRPTQRFEVAFEILGTQVYGKKEKCEVGLDRMIREGIYTCAYPPHEGDFVLPEKLKPDQLNSRQVLNAYWARWSQWYKYQPLEHVRDYFGEKVAFYFAFLGYYTMWLVPASLMGIVVFLYGCSNVGNHPTIKEACNSGKSFKMCPLCEDEKSEACSYWYLSELCLYVTASYVFDNDGTVLYSVFVSFWACAFLENWKRTTATLAYKWDVMEFVEIEERPRPEFASQCSEYAEDPVTGNLEPFFPSRKRTPRIIVGILSLVVMMILSASCLVIMLVVRAVILSSLFENELFRSRAVTIANTSSACINLVLVLLLELLYEKVAVSITEWEMHRTQTKFENRLILKVFIFEFFNYYVSIAYTALVKGNLSGSPGNYNTLFGTRFAQCINGSCMFELTQLLAVIVIGKQLAVNFIEILMPKLLTWFHQCFLGIRLSNTKATKQWEKDHMLIPYDQGLLMEYLEVILQFGFITLFVPAFPLAPLFAMLNNLVEIRLDAKKLVCGTRRPLPERAQSIGIWFSILKFIVYLSTLSNALLMAFTSEFLPTTVYRFVYSLDLEGYKNFTLKWAPPNTTSEPCRYNSVFSVDAGYSEFFWKLASARLIFALSYQQAVMTLSSLINRLIPDVPKDLRRKMKRQRYLAKQALVGAEQLPMSQQQSPVAQARRAGGFVS